MNGRVSRPVLLTGYDVKRCARRIHNEWDPTIETAAWEVPESLQKRFDDGKAFEETVFAELRAALDPSRYVDLTGHRGKEVTVDATVAAMEAGVEVIIGGWLPDDLEGGRTGRPDLLVRVDVIDGRAVYAPGDVKWHQVTRKAPKGTLSYSSFADPASRLSVSGRAVQTSQRIDDYLQLAHYWRMLEALGRTPQGEPAGFIIGTDDLRDRGVEGRVLTWVDLGMPLFETYSRSQGKAKRTALERYDHEQVFRLEVARVSAGRTGSVDDPAPLVEPIFKAECDSCPWYDHCLGVAGPDVASAHIRSGRLSVREWQALGRAGVRTLAELAALDPDDETFRASYLPEVTNVRDPLAKLADAVRRARMTQAGVGLERITEGPIDVPRADIEIDLDVEWGDDQRVYLWGCLVSRDGAPPVYRSFARWDDLSDDDARALALEFATWLREEIGAAEKAGRSLRVYHYSPAELTHLRKALGDVSDVEAVFVDLLDVVKEHFFGLRGLGVKQVAPEFGFAWRDEDPGGLQSQLWLVQARSGSDASVREAARRRILEYNEDDVRATAAIRNGL